MRFKEIPASSGGAGITDYNIAALAIGAVADKAHGQLTSTYTVNANPVNLENTSSDLVYMVRARIVAVGAQTNMSTVGVAYQDFETAVGAMVLRPGISKTVTGSTVATTVTQITSSGGSNADFNRVYDATGFGSPRPDFNNPDFGHTLRNYDGTKWYITGFWDGGSVEYYQCASTNITPIGLTFTGVPDQDWSALATIPGPTLSKTGGPSSGSASGTYRYEIQILALLETDYDAHEIGTFNDLVVDSYVKTAQVIYSEEFNVTATIYP